MTESRTDQSMIERVAFAICANADDSQLSNHTVCPRLCLTCHNQAHAAIAAMREPTELVAIQVGDAINCAPQTACDAARFVVGVFVDAALGEGK